MFTLFNEWLMVGCFCAVLLYDHIVFSSESKKIEGQGGYKFDMTAPVPTMFSFGATRGNN